MIEPHSAQLGASAWAAKVTWLLPTPRPRVPRVLRGLPLPFVPLPLTGAASERGASEEAPSPAWGVEVATAVVEKPTEAGFSAPPAPPLSGEAGPAVPAEPLPKLPALPIPPAAPRPKLSGCTEVSLAAERSTRPSVARSSAGRKREPSQRKMESMMDLAMGISGLLVKP